MTTKNAVPLTFWSDPGHGWLEVPTGLAGRLVPPRYFSEYSYRGPATRGPGSSYYLEEDCDAGIFLAAAKRQGVEVAVVEAEDTGGRIRKMDSLPPAQITSQVYRQIVSESCATLA